MNTYLVKAHVFSLVITFTLLCFLSFSHAQTRTLIVGFPTQTKIAINYTQSNTSADMMNAMNGAAQYWANRLISSQTIEIDFLLRPLTCTTTSGTLASAAIKSLLSNFTNAPKKDIAYPIALANHFAARDYAPNSADMRISVNSEIGTSSCLSRTQFHYQLTSYATQSFTVSLYGVMIHEMAHGLGFSDNITSDGEFINFRPSIYAHYMFNVRTQQNITDTSLSSTARTSLINDENNLVWSGAAVNTLANSSSTIVGHLTQGLSNKQVLLHPTSASHFEKKLTPDEIMEPIINSSPTITLTLALLLDLGWESYTATSDNDGDGVRDAVDNCIFNNNPTQLDTDLDRLGNVCDADDDNDGMSDAYEIQYSLDPLNANDASQDLDNDGFSNLVEFQTGLNPKLHSDSRLSTLDIGMPLSPIFSSVIQGYTVTITSGAGVLQPTFSSNISGTVVTATFNGNAISSAQSKTLSTGINNLLITTQAPDSLAPSRLYTVKIDYQLPPASISTFNLDIDDNSSLEIFHDGLLLMRWISGGAYRTETNLCSDTAISSKANRTCAQIKMHLQSAFDLNLLDIDSNGITEINTDGLLIMRWISGVPYRNITNLCANQALAINAQRDCNQVLTYLQRFTP